MQIFIEEKVVFPYTLAYKCVVFFSCTIFPEEQALWHNQDPGADRGFVLGDIEET